MEWFVAFVRAVVCLVFYAFVLSHLWRWVVVPRFKLPELDPSDVALLLLLVHAAIAVVRSLGESSALLSAKISAFF